MSQDVTKEIDRFYKLEADFEKKREKFSRNGIDRGERKVLDGIQQLIKQSRKILTAQGIVIVDGNKKPQVAPPGPPRDGNNEIEYQGLPLEKLNPNDKTNAKARAYRVESGVERLDDTANRLDKKASLHQGHHELFEASRLHTEDVNDALKKDLKNGGFRKLSKAVGPQFDKTLASYQSASIKVAKSLDTLKAQAWKLAAAQSAITQAETAIQSYDLEKQRNAENKKLAETKEKLKDVGVIVGIIKDVAKDPLGTAKKKGIEIATSLIDKALVELLGGAVYEQKIKELEARIAKITGRLDELKMTDLKEGLNGAVANMNAEKENTNAMRKDLELAKKEQADNINSLAIMERNHPGATTVFGQLDNYFDIVKVQSEQLMESSKELEHVLTDAQGVKDYSSVVRKALEDDKKDMDKLVTGDINLSSQAMVLEGQADNIIDYTKKMDDWYKSKQVDRQIQQQRDFQAYLSRNEQFDYVGEVIGWVQKPGLD